LKNGDLTVFSWQLARKNQGSSTDSAGRHESYIDQLLFGDGNEALK